MKNKNSFEIYSYKTPKLRENQHIYEHWQLLLSHQPSNIPNIHEFDDAMRLFYTNAEVASYNDHDQLMKLQEHVTNINARHSSLAAKNMSSDEMSGLEPTIFLAKGAKVILTMNLWPSVGLCNGATGIIVIEIIYIV